MIERVLIDNGFTEKEAKVYLTVLEAGEIPVARIATKTQLKRTTVYSIVEELQTRSILSIQKRRGVQYVSALSPQVLVDRFLQAASTAKDVLPSLIEMAYSSPLKPRVRFLEGIDGIKAILQEVNTVSKAEPGMIFTDYAQMPKEIFALIRKTVKIRKTENNFLHILVPNNGRNLEVQSEEDKFHYAEHRIADFPIKSFPLELTLFDNTKVGFLSFEKNELFGVVIDSKAIYLTLKNLFLLVWAHAKPRGKI